MIAKEKCYQKRPKKALKCVKETCTLSAGTTNKDVVKVSYISLLNFYFNHSTSKNEYVALKGDINNCKNVVNCFRVFFSSPSFALLYIIKLFRSGGVSWS